MAEKLASLTSNGVPARTRASTHEREQALARTLESKLEEGYSLESQDETRAVLSIRGRRGWFGLTHGAGARYEVTVDEQGRARSRRL
jgi:hypothetical protein